MDRVFSVGEISDQFWSPPPPPPPPPSAQPDDSSKMNRSASDEVVEIKDKDNDSFSVANDKTTASSSFSNGRCTPPFNVAAAPSAPPNIPMDSEEYQAFLKSKLNLACAAAALSLPLRLGSGQIRLENVVKLKNGFFTDSASVQKPQDSSARADSGSQASNASQLGSHATSKEAAAGGDLSRSQLVDANGPVGISSLPNAQKNSGATVKATTSGSSREQSEDDEMKEKLK
ncbi:hypothetical protein GH714_023592 [Hevea brasiliensis]|uniref:Basic leucine-zipper C-terminal domain-containing protein n=1 Tax=Hevea brasiliensis TaxID=3981 RepID=A0A6A6LAG9_HEVBR|nr:hypothetical protein GH714_023592 [Hevea brasiliensis]